MKIIGLTGPTGAGKGAVSALFAELGVPFVDTDAVYHALLEESDPLTNELVSAFGSEILDESGRVARKKLAATVFGHENTPALLERLNAIAHKYVMAKTHELVQEAKQNGAVAIVIDAPQLFEAHIEEECDLVVGVLADDEERLSRITARDGISAHDAKVRMRAQHGAEYFREHCDVILQNDGDMDALRDRVVALYHTIISK